MPLDQRMKISRYLIQSRLGAGGMGEVYKAYDTTLDRPVALKLLAAHLVEDPDKLRRFVQEAKAASVLNHPNIVTIYEIGKASPLQPAPDAGGARETGSDNGGTASLVPIDFIAMEFIDGATLGEKIHTEKCEVRRLLEYLAQVADGLAKAHSSGIVHRDLKPENIMISRDEYAKILDFGLAKLVEQTAPADPNIEEADTMLLGRTRPGVIMGTAGYMSPEQVLGKAVDQRSDIFALGCILYEAATGRQAFEGETLIDSLHKIVHGQAPPIRESNPDVPTELQRIIRKCLSKNPDERYQSAKELGIDLRDLIREYDSGSLPARDAGSVPAQDYGSQPISQNDMNKDATHNAIVSGRATTSIPVPVATMPGTTRKTQALIAIILVAPIIAVVAVFMFLGRQKPGSAGIGSFQTGRINKLTATGKTLLAAISPDGKYAAFTDAAAGQESLWVRQVATASNIRIVQPLEASYRGLTFSPDGEFVYYAVLEKGGSTAGLFRIPALGGLPKKITEGLAGAVTFAPDGKRFAFVRNMRDQQESVLLIANSDGSGERKLGSLTMPDVLAAPAWSPDGATIACVERRFDKGFHCLLAGYLVADGTKHAIPQRWGSITGVAWLADGRELVISATDQAPVVSKTQIWQVTYPDGRASRITNDLNSYAGISLSADSSALVSVQTDTISNLWVVPGATTAKAVQISSGSSVYTQPAWTRDGRIVCSCDAGGASDIWMMDSDGKNPKQLTSDAGVNVFPQVSRDGKYIVFTSNRAGDKGLLNIWRMDINGSNQQQLTSGQGELFPYPDADSNWVFYITISETVRRPQLCRVPIGGGEPVLVSDAFLACPVASPDGKFVAVAYFQQATANPKLAVMRVEGGAPLAQFDVGLTIERLTGPSYRWSADAKRLLYEQDRAGVTNIWYQPLPSGAPRQVTEFNTDQIFYFDSSRDGRLVCARGSTTTDVVLVRNQQGAVE